MELADFRCRMQEYGFAVVRAAIGESLLERLRADLPAQLERCRAVRARNGLGDEFTGAAHHVIGAGDAFDAFLRESFADALVRDYFGSEYILNSFGALDNLRSDDPLYAHGARFHRDVRTWAGDFRLMLNMLVMLDDFTEANGATRVVPGSHLHAARPDDAELERRAIQVTGTAGDVLLFDSNLWHAAAPNRTDRSRRALTLTFTRPFMKQQLDYPRLLGEDYTEDPRLRQLLGYNARVPASLEQWYQPPERRYYKPGQG